MLVNIADTVLDIDDEPIINGRTDAPMTYHEMINDVLNSRPDDAMKCFDLLLKMRGKSEVDLDEEERTFLKKRANGFLLPIGYGRLSERLSDPPPSPQVAEEVAPAPAETEA